MYIKIAERLKPFCHLPGTCCILPGSTYELQIFPTLLRISNLTTPTAECLCVIHLNITGPVKNFTIQNDLEKGEVRVWGETQTGFLRYRLNAHKNGKAVRLLVEKAPENSLEISYQEKSWILKEKEQHCFFHAESISEEAIFQPDVQERLSLGCHKSQDWELIQRRQELIEILPIWHRLGQLIYPTAFSDFSPVGTLSLLQQCQEQALDSQPEKLHSIWTALFLAGFKSLLVPRLQDDFHQGIISVKKDERNISPLLLLTEGTKLMRDLFIRYNEGKLYILPTLLPEFHAGRLMHVKIPGGFFSLEWTKKRVRRCEFKVDAEADIQLQLHFRHAKQCRMRMGSKDKGQTIISGQIIDLKKNQHYFFDNFS